MIETLREDANDTNDGDNDTTKCFTQYYQLSPIGSNDESHSNKTCLADISANMINNMRQCKSNLRSNMLRIVLNSENEVLIKLLQDGGWLILQEWLLDARNIVDVSFMIDILQFYKLGPVIPKLLKDDDTCMKVVKAFTASPDQDIKVNSTVVFCKWKETIDNIDKEIGSVKIDESSGEQTELQITTIALDAKNESISQLLIDDISPNASISSETINASSFKIIKKRKYVADPMESEAVNTPKKLKVDKEINVIIPEVKSILKVHSANVSDSTKVKKSVTWVTDEKICQIKLIEIIPGERTNVKMQPPPIPLLNLDNNNTIETNANDSFKSIEDKPLIPWKCIPIDFTISNDQPQQGCDSTEKNVQAERERHSLLTLYFNKRSIPDTAAEPELNKVDDDIPCKEIPFTAVEEINSIANNSENNVVVREENLVQTKPCQIINQNFTVSPPTKPPSPNNFLIKTNEGVIKNTQNSSLQDNPLKKMVCTFFKRGKCKFGHKCRNIHEPTMYQAISGSMFMPNNVNLQTCTM